MKPVDRLTPTVAELAIEILKIWAAAGRCSAYSPSELAKECVKAARVIKEQ